MKTEYADKDDRPSAIASIGEAAVNINKLLCAERSKRSSPNQITKSSAKEDILQEIWSRLVKENIVREDLKINVTLDPAYVDGTICEVCNSYHNSVRAIQTIGNVMDRATCTIISKHLDEYITAINFCRFNLISIEGQRRFGFMKLGEG